MKKLFGILMAATTITGCVSTKNMTNSLPSGFDKEGHRGSRGLSPENTIPAMLKAIDLGVTTLEMDVVISADRKVVVSHDVNFNEVITTTPEGKYLSKSEAEHHLLYHMTYDSIRKYDVGMKPHPGFPEQEKIPAVKPLLTDLIKTTEGYAKEKGQTIRYNIEIKSKPENDGLKHPPAEEFVDIVVATIKASGVMNRTIIQSFDERVLRILHRKYPAVLTSFLVEGTDRRSLVDILAALGFQPAVLSPHYSLVTPELVKQVHSRGMKIIPWTVNDLPTMKRLEELGVDGIITDYPNLFQQL